MIKYILNIYNYRLFIICNSLFIEYLHTCNVYTHVYRYIDHLIDSDTIHCSSITICFIYNILYITYIYIYI